MNMTTKMINAYYCQASYMYRGTFGSKKEHDGSSPLWRQRGKVSLLVLTDDGSSLLGQDWLQNLKLDWQQINKLHSETLQHVLQRHKDILRMD